MKKSWGFLFLMFAQSGIWAAQCFQRDIQKLDLNPQMGATRKQMGGTCFAYQGSAVLQAALTRSGLLDAQKNCEISPEYCAFDMCQAVNPQNKNRTAAKILSESNRAFESYSLLDGSSKENLEEKLRDLTQKTQIPLDTAELKKALVDLYQNTIVPEKSKEELSRLLKKYEKYQNSKNANKQDLAELIKLIEQKALEVSNSPCKAIECAQAKDKLSQTIEIQKHGFGVKSLIKPSDQSLCKTNSKLRSEKLKEMLETLCSGIPIAVDANLGAGSFEENAGTYDLPKWQKMTPQKQSQDSLHAMVIKGFVRESGEDYFLLRNSWGGESEMRVKMSQLCEFRAAAVIATKEETSGLENSYTRRDLAIKFKEKIKKTPNLGLLREQELVDEPVRHE